MATAQTTSAAKVPRRAGDALCCLRNQLHQKTFMRHYFRGKGILDAVYAHTPPLTR